ncbi:DMT family transporter [Halomonas sp. HNIBRBA4712]|uniref:DMT family transporter n=1 Tax=Halomonas sp. HNIBRBA4712 TaxID=3373087 RepID=UPI00374623AE
MKPQGSLNSSATYAATVVQDRRPVNAGAASLMVLFCLALGLQQVAIKGVAEEISPLSQIALRSAIAAMVVLGFAYAKRLRARDVRAHWRPGVLVGLGFTGEFLFLAWGLEYTLASHMSVFLYTAPIFAALGLHHFVPDEQLAWRQWGGVGLAFAGMAVAMTPGPASASKEILLGDALGLLAGLCWAATTLVIRTSSLSRAPAELTLGFQLSVTALILLPAALLTGELLAARFTPLTLMSLGFQALIISFAALLLWFSLLRRFRASQLGVFSLLAPLFGVLFGTLLLGEPLGIAFMVGCGFILLGLVLVMR